MNWKVIFPSLIFILFYAIVLIIYFSISDDIFEIWSSFFTLFITGLTLIIIFLTLKSYERANSFYERANKLNEKNLKFAQDDLISAKKNFEITQRQTTLIQYTEKFKLFDLLTKQTIDIVIERTLSDHFRTKFQAITIQNIFTTYRDILNEITTTFIIKENVFGSVTFDDIKPIFIRFHNKILTILSLLKVELENIYYDEGVYDNDKKQLIEFYKNYILYDYLKLILFLEKMDIECKKSDIPLMCDLLCNYKFPNAPLFDLNAFSNLKNYIEKFDMLTFTAFVDDPKK